MTLRKNKAEVLKKEARRTSGNEKKNEIKNAMDE